MTPTEVVLEPEPGGRPSISGAAVLAAVFVIATCGLIYELVAGTVASYVLGDSVTQFSTVIGVYLSAMGVGAWLSRMIDRNVVNRFVEVEIAVALVGGLSAAILFFSFAQLAFFRVVLYGLVLSIGTLVGLEIPLMMRILKDNYDLKELVARVLTVDYLGALVASLSFPLFLVPKLGLVRGALAVGCLNAAVALWCTFVFAPAFARARQAMFLRVEAALVLALLVVGMIFADPITTLAESEFYPGEVVYSKTSDYQRVIVTRAKGGFQLFLNGNLQFASADEHRYHEALVHPAMSAYAERAGRHAVHVLILGGGDGLAAREVLKWSGVEAVTLVDLDPVITDLARDLPLLRDQNHASMHDPRMTVVNQDAMVWLAERGEGAPHFEVVIVDFPDPNNFSLGKLYTTRFYHLLQRAMTPEAVVVVQATSPLLARQSFWCVVETLEAAKLSALAYHANVPSFGEWGYVLAARGELAPPRALPSFPLSFLTTEILPTLFVFPPDMARVPAEANRLNNQVLVQYYEAEWSRWN